MCLKQAYRKHPEREDSEFVFEPAVDRRAPGQQYQQPAGDNQAHGPAKEFETIE
jgi:hypothetical protein